MIRYAAPIEPPEEELEVILPLWMAQRILWELEAGTTKDSRNYSQALRSRIAVTMEKHEKPNKPR